MPIEIQENLFYSKTELLKILNIGDSTYSRYRREGLPSHKVGQEVYSQGQEIIEFILARNGGENCFSKNVKKITGARK